VTNQLNQIHKQNLSYARSHCIADAQTHACGSSYAGEVFFGSSCGMRPRAAPAPPPRLHSNGRQLLPRPQQQQRSRVMSRLSGKAILGSLAAAVAGSLARQGASAGRQQQQQRWDSSRQPQDHKQLTGCCRWFVVRRLIDRCEIVLCKWCVVRRLIDRCMIDATSYCTSGALYDA
jgi:hypothetical protein